MAEKKKFIDVEVPILNKSIRVLGTVKDLTGRTIKLDLARQLRGKGVIVTFHIFNFEEKLIAVPKKTELIKSYLTRILRKRTDNVEDSFLAHCSDIRATVKPFLITRKRVSRAVRRSLRNTAREFLLNYIKEKTYNEICNEILEGSLQKNMLPKLKKVYPLAFCDIRVFETKDLMKIDLASVVVKAEETEDIEQAIEANQEVEQAVEAEKKEVEKPEETAEEAKEETEKVEEAEKEKVEKAIEETKEEEAEEAEEEKEKTETVTKDVEEEKEDAVKE